MAINPELNKYINSLQKKVRTYEKALWQIRVMDVSDQPLRLSRKVCGYINVPNYESCVDKMRGIATQALSGK